MRYLVSYLNTHVQSNRIIPLKPLVAENSDFFLGIYFEFMAWNLHVQERIWLVSKETTVLLAGIKK